MAQKRITVADVAKQAGVDRSTVSRALRGDSRISPATVAKVSAAASRLGYVPNSAARSLALGKSDVITAIVPGLAFAFSSMVLGGVEKAVRRTKYHLRVETASQPRLFQEQGIKDKDELAETLKNAALGGAADGVILITQDFPSVQLEEMYEKVGFPIVLVEGRSRWGSRVALDNVEAARIATEHLVKRGCRRLALVTGNIRLFRSYAERQQGFLKAIKASPERLKPPLIFQTPDMDPENMESVAEKLLQQRAQFDGLVVSAGDPYALRLLPLLKRGGLRVPEDAAMIGFDDLEASEAAGLTTVRQPLEQFGLKAVEMLVEMIESKDTPRLREWLAVPTLIVRKTA